MLHVDVSAAAVVEFDSASAAAALPLTSGA